MVPVLQTTLGRRMILVLQTMPVVQTTSGHQMVLVLQIVLALRTTPGRRVIPALQATKEVGAEAKKVAERTSEQIWLASF
jgi:hypothetical protein